MTLSPAREVKAVQKLTERQAQVLSFIEKRVQNQGFPPTLREIGDHLEIKSTNGVNDHLKALERKGYINRQGKRSRALSLVQPGPDSPPISSGTIHRIPIIGRVAAGVPLLAEEHAEGSVAVDSFFIGNSTRVYALRVTGDSMIEDGIFDGDYIFVRKQPVANPGSIVVAMIDGEATVKRFFPEGERVRFEPANARMAPIYVSRDDFRDTQILGTVVGLYRKI